MSPRIVAGSAIVALVLCLNALPDAGAINRVQLGPAPKPYVHTFEMPQFGRNWQVYVGGTAYQTENVIHLFS